MYHDKNYLEEIEYYIQEDCFTVGELIQFLGKYPKEMKVMGTWEGTVHGIKKDNIYVSLTDRLYAEDGKIYQKVSYWKPLIK